MTVLCVVAHPDDEILGVGGTLSRHVSSGEDVFVTILTDGISARAKKENKDPIEVKNLKESRKENARRACGHLCIDNVTFHEFPNQALDTVPLLDIVQTIEEDIEDFRPETIYTHHYGDLSIDHQRTCQAVLTAARPLKGTSVSRVAAFETLSSTEWSVQDGSKSFKPNSFVDIEEHLSKKCEAFSEYTQEMREHPHPRTIENIKQNARLWGSKAGLTAAEPFELLREVRIGPSSFPSR